MAGDLQPLDEKFAIVDDQGRPTLYFIQWCQQRQIDITDALTLLGLEDYLLAHKLQEGSGIQITPSGNISDSPVIAADVQEILDQISTTRGSIIYRGLLGWAALGPGTAGQLLQTNGAGADPSWVTSGGGGGALSLISEQQPNGVGTVSFTAIPATYRDLVVIVRGRGSIAAASMAVTAQFNTDTGANYGRIRSGGSNGTSSSASTVGDTGVSLGGIAGNTATANKSGAIRADILDYRGTTFFKEVLSQEGRSESNATSGQSTNLYASYWNNTAAINRVDVIGNGGNFLLGTVVSLYGRS